MVRLGQEQRLLYSAVSEAAAGAGQLTELQEVKAALGGEAVMSVVQVSAWRGDVKLGVVAPVAWQEVQEQGQELLLLVAAEPLCLGECDEGWGCDQVQERVNSDAELVEEEWDSECGFLETLEALQESSLGRKNWTFVPVKMKK